MSIDKNTIRKVARLARLEVSEEDVDRLTPQVGGIMKWIEQLQELNTNNIEPLANVVNTELYLRKDEVTDGGIPEKILTNAPETVSNYFVVPKIVEQE
ncbi:MAG: Asp-tRNA(Asn)/Glu-tRNA(Gln) amidotransferase subunit GatC [Alphaproteobacteria bacterium]